MKVLGIHGFKRTDKVIDFFEGTAKNLSKKGIVMDSPEFEIGENINYKNWEKKLDEIKLENYEIILSHSMGCRVIIEYIAEKKIKFKKIILVAPAIQVKTNQVIEFYKEMKHDFKEINNYVEEVIILFSNDDSVVRIEGAQKLAKELNAKLIEVTGYGHFNLEEVKIIEDFIIN